MDEPIPFTTGPLKNWPIVEEKIREALDHEDFTDLTDEMRDEVAKSVQSFWESTYEPPLDARHTWSIGEPVTVEDVAEIQGILAASIDCASRLMQRALTDRFGVAVELVRLRRILRDHGLDE